MTPFRQALRAALASRRLAWLFAPLSAGNLCVLTVHRFGTDAQTDGRGMDPILLDEVLRRLRSNGYRFEDLHAALATFDAGERLPPRSVVFTVDDGYEDFELGAEVFRRHGCPVTVFLTTGFIDGTTWLWWDKVEYCCLHAVAGEYRIDGCPVVVALREDRAARISTAERLWEHCKLIPEPDKQGLIRELARVTAVSLPESPPEEYAPLTWDQIRRLEEEGARFAPHTVTHPILSRLSDRQAELEITESWRRVREEVRFPTPVLAYPNGTPADYGEREFRIAREAELAGAVTTVRGYVTSELFRGSSNGRFAMPRFAKPVDPAWVCLKASGFDRLRPARP